MLKWFRTSTTTLGVLFFIVIVTVLFAPSMESNFLDNLAIGLMVLAFVLCIVSLVTGIGAFFQWMTRGQAEKAKRGLALSYDDAMFNRIMSRLDEEERAYLQGYLTPKAHEATDDFFYATEENQASNEKYT